MTGGTIEIIRRTLEDAAAQVSGPQDRESVRVSNVGDIVRLIPYVIGKHSLSVVVGQETISESNTSPANR